MQSAQCGREATSSSNQHHSLFWKDRTQRGANPEGQFSRIPTLDLPCIHNFIWALENIHKIFRAGRGAHRRNTTKLYAANIAPSWWGVLLLESTAAQTHSSPLTFVHTHCWKTLQIPFLPDLKFWSCLIHIQSCIQNSMPPVGSMSEQNKPCCAALWEM